MKATGSDAKVRGMWAILATTSAWAISCEDIVLLIDAGVPSETVIQAVRDAAPPPKAEDIACLSEHNAPTTLLDAARAAAGIGDTSAGRGREGSRAPIPPIDDETGNQRAAPKSNQRAAGADLTPVERQFEDWTLLQLDGALGASTKATNDRLSMVMVNCEGQAVLQVSAINLTLATMRVPYITEVAFDAGPFTRVVDDAHLPLSDVERMLGGRKMYVRWTFYEGTVGAEFSLRGSRAALEPVLRQCGLRTH